ncbi:TonB-dependent receptor [Elongatibacter sediminis]|uniref:TonB-dependent receptor n=1 Tax=Elongatibacter sediminis TaxID=3119006 RepID=A0AAW9R654_9GAMM
MRRKIGESHLALLVAVSAGLGVQAPLASAQQEAALEEVIVTAQRREQTLRDVPISITAFTSASIESNMIKNVEDYFAKAPNLSISDGATRSGNVSTSSHGLAIRGISNVGGDSLSYGFYIDDFNTTRATVNPQLVDMSRIEILRGPQGTFFGRNASAGVISLTTNKPNENLEGNVSVQYGSFNTWETVGTVNLPVSDKLMFRASGKIAGSDGYADNYHPIGGDNGYDHKFGRIAARILPTDNWTIDLTATFNDEEQDDLGLIATGVYVPGAIGGFLCSVAAPQCPHDTEFGIYPENTDLYSHNNPLVVKDEYQMYTANIVWQGDNLRFTSVTGYINTDFHRDGELDMGSLDIVNEDFEDIEKTAFSQEFRLQSTHDGPFNWIIGGIWAKDTHDEIESINFGADQTTLDTFGVFPHFIIELSTVDRTIKSKALFAEGTWQATDKLTLTAGARWSQDKIELSQTKIDFESLLPPQSSSDTWEDIAPRVTASYAFSDTANVYATVAKGWKSGGINLELTTPDDAVNKFDEEVLWNYEIGIKSNFLNNRVRANLALFRIDWEDVQVNASRLILEDGELRSVQGVSNGAKATSQGFEFELQALPTPQLALGFNAGYLDADWDEFENAVTGYGELDLSGQQLPKAPKWSVSADAQYNFPLNTGWEGFVRAEFSYKDDYLYDVNGTAGALLGYEFPFLIPSHSVWNFRAGIQNDKYRLVAYVQNAFDDNYYTSTFDFGFSNGASVVPSYRSYGIRGTAYFGK